MALTRSVFTQVTQAEYGAWLYAAILSGDVDRYLKAIVDAVRHRKSLLEVLDGEVPPQYKVEDGYGDVVFKTYQLQPISVDINVIPPGPITATVVPGGAVTTSAVFTGKITPLNQSNAAKLPEDRRVDFDGHVFDKRHIVGLVIEVEARLPKTGGKIKLPLTIAGVGDKSVKLIQIAEPPLEAKIGNNLLHAKWVNHNVPLFIGRSYIKRYLDI